MTDQKKFAIAIYNGPSLEGYVTLGRGKDGKPAVSMWHPYVASRETIEATARTIAKSSPPQGKRMRIIPAEKWMIQP